MRLFALNRRSSDRTSQPSTSRSASRSISWPLFSTITLLNTLLSLSYLSPSALVSGAAVSPGFCGDCQTFNNAITPCGASFKPSDIEINGTYIPPASAAKCICTDLMQKLLWNCARCELLAGFGAHSQPPQAYQTQCIGWGISFADWKAPYTGEIAPGTATQLTGGANPPAVPAPGTTGANPTTGGAGSTTGSASGSSSGAAPSGSTSDDSNSGAGSGPNGTAIGISVGIVGVAVLAGAVSIIMMRRSRRRRHAPLDLGDNYVGLDDHQWEKPSRPQTPPMMPAAIASPVLSRGPMPAPHRPSPFESRPGGGGSVVGGYDGKYDQYEPYGHGAPGGYDNYSNHGGYDQAYHQSGYAPARDFGYEHAMPTSGTPLPPYHGGKGPEGGHYM